MKATSLFRKYLSSIVCLVLILGLGQVGLGQKGGQGLDNIRGLVLVEGPGHNDLANGFLNWDFRPEAPKLVLRLEGKEPIDQAYFKEEIQGLKLLREGDKHKIFLGQEDLDPETKALEWEAGKVLISPGPKARKELAKGWDLDISDNSRTSGGSYRIFLVTKEGEKELGLEVDQEKGPVGYEFLELRERPRVLWTQPARGASHVNPEDLYRVFRQGDQVERGYYLRLTFEDLGGLALRPDSQDYLTRSWLRKKGELDNLIDGTRKLVFQASSLYLPLGEALDLDQDYEAYLEGGHYLDYPGYGLEGEASLGLARNRSYGWSFRTGSQPLVTGLYEGSFVENYDRNYPLVLEGQGLDPSTDVDFVDSRGDSYPAYDVDFRSGSEGGPDRLYVYLPRGRQRLRPGQYRLVLYNRGGQETETDYGSLSIVAEGSRPPRDGSFQREDDYYGQVLAQRKTSSDTLYLEDSRSYLSLDLDQLMGEETWSRAVEISRRTMARLNLRSKWAYVTVENLRRTGSGPGLLRVGRASPLVVEEIKPLLRGRRILSDFIEVQGEDLDFDSVYLELGARGDLGEGAGIYVYDQLGRNFFKLGSQVDYINQKVLGQAYSGGIFVIVE